MAASDIAIAGAKAAISVLPYGSVLIELFGDAIPSAHDRANQLANDLLRERVAELGEEVDREYVKSDEFVDLCKTCMFIVERTQHEEKLRGAANILANAAMEQGTEGKLTYAELDHFARCLEALSLEAIHVLREAVAARNLNELAPERIAHTLGIENDLAIGLLRQLETCDFVLLSFSSARYNDQDSVVMRVRPKAKSFIEFIMDAGRPK
jgi:hypothetical protein